MSRRATIFVVAAASAALAFPCSPSGAKDCGRLPTGKNPSPEDIGKAMEVLSAKHSVPTEIVKGIAYQESGVQQWRADGSFVHNVSDCGMGMMQLTGSTAAQFDEDKLKDDWKYNLEAGLKVLVAKWQRAEREGKVTADPADRRVLENWYYPVAYYYGGKTDSYVTKIFAHVAKRPGVLQVLLRRSVEITLPGAAIKGWTHGKKFRALEGNRFLDENGATVKAPTHQGTIGDEETLARLEVELARARKAIKDGQLAAAVRSLAAACAVELELEPRRKARELLDQLEKDAQARLAEADARAAAGDKDGALKLARKVASDFAAVPLGKQAKARADEISKLPAQKGEPAAKGEAPRPAVSDRPSVSDKPAVSPDAEGQGPDRP